MARKKLNHAYEVVWSERSSMTIGHRFMMAKLPVDENGVYEFHALREVDGRTQCVVDAKVRFLGVLDIKDPEKLYAALCAL